MKLILNGGGVGSSVADARAKLNEVIDHNKNILYVPLAWPDPTFAGCYEFMSKELSDVDARGIHMIRSAGELADMNYQEFAFMYIGGGNTFQLLKLLKDSGCFTKIKDYLNYDGIVYGGSAGAIIFGKDLDSCHTDDTNEVNLQDINGFDLIGGYSLLCHYTNRNEERTLASTNYLLELSKTKPVIALPEEDTIFVDNGNIEIFGSKPYYKFVDGERIQIQMNF